MQTCIELNGFNESYYINNNSAFEWIICYHYTLLKATGITSISVFSSQSCISKLSFTICQLDSTIPDLFSSSSYTNEHKSQWVAVSVYFNCLCLCMRKNSSNIHSVQRKKSCNDHFMNVDFISYCDAVEVSKNKSDLVGAASLYKSCHFSNATCPHHNSQG